MKNTRRGLLWLVLLIGMLSPGCKSPYGLDPTREEKWMQASQRSALDSKGLSPFTALALKQRDLDDRQLDDAAAALYAEVQGTRARQTVAALAEVCYLRAKRHKKHSPEATRLHLTALRLAYAYMFDDTLDKPVSPFGQPGGRGCGLVSRRPDRVQVHDVPAYVFQPA